MELSARAIEEHRFASSVNGYRKQDVDDFQAEAASYVSNLEERLAIARTKAEKAHAELAEMRERIERELDDTRRARARILDEARAEATALSDATARGHGAGAPHASAIVHQAEATAHLKLAEAQSATDRAHDEADRIIREAEEAAERREAEADRVLDEAKAESHRLQTETRRYRAEMEANLAEIKRILDSARTSDGTGSDKGVARDDVVVDLRQEHEARAGSDG